MKIHEFTEGKKGLEESDIDKLSIENLGVMVVAQQLAQMTHSPAVVICTFHPDKEEGTISACIHPDFKDFKELATTLRGLADQIEENQKDLHTMAERAKVYQASKQANNPDTVKH